jgi:hypothetical protein
VISVNTSFVDEHKYVTLSQAASVYCDVLEVEGPNVIDEHIDPIVAVVGE